MDYHIGKVLLACFLLCCVCTDRARQRCKGLAVKIADVFDLYTISASVNAKEAFIRAETDLEMVAPARWTAQAMQGMKSNAYLYEVTWAFPSQGGQQLGAFHGIDPWLNPRNKVIVAVATNRRSGPRRCTSSREVHGKRLPARASTGSWGTNA